MSVNIDQFLRMYCTDYDKIENYDKAVADESQCWEIHHRLETHDENGNERQHEVSIKELKEKGLYIHRPPEEFIFMTKSDHMSLHLRIRRKEHPLTEETKQKMYENRKGMRWFTDGVHQTKAYECPEGYWSGKLPSEEKTNLKKSNHFKKCKWWTNGTIDKFTIDCPDGFYAGRSNFKRKEVVNFG